MVPSNQRDGWQWGFVSGVCLCLRAEVRSRINKQIQRTLISVNLSQPLGNKKKKTRNFSRTVAPLPKSAATRWQLRRWKFCKAHVKSLFGCFAVLIGAAKHLSSVPHRLNTAHLLRVLCVPTRHYSTWITICICPALLSLAFSLKSGRVNDTLRKCPNMCS